MYAAPCSCRVSMRRMPSLIEHSSASSIGPPMMKKMSLTPCAFRHRARISLPVNSAISVSSSRFGSDHPFFLQSIDIGRTHAKPLAEDLRGMLSEQRGGLQLWRFAVEAHRPGRHLEGACRVLHDLQDAALGKARLVHQLHRI